MKRFFLIFFVLLVFGFQVVGQELQMNINKDTMLIGDHFELSLSLPFQVDEQVFFPEFNDTSEIEFVEELATDTIENQILKTYILTIFREGRYIIGDIPVLVQDKSGSIDTLLSNTIEITVNTVEVDTTQAIKPIKAEKLPPFPWQSFLWKAGLVLLFILLVILGIIAWILKKKNGQIFKKKPKTKLDFYHEALKQLNDLEQQRLWQKDEVKAYYLSLSEILRSYLEGRFNMAAMELTTTELNKQLKMKSNLKKPLIEVLSQADLAKFAKFKPSAEENKKMMYLSKAFIEQTKPKIEKDKKKK